MSENSTVETLVSEVEDRLSQYRKSYKGLTWREKVLLLVNVSGSIKTLGKITNPDAAKVGARERIRLYLLDNVGVTIAAAELEVVSDRPHCVLKTWQYPMHVVLSLVAQPGRRTNIGQAVNMTK